MVTPGARLACPQAALRRRGLRPCCPEHLQGSEAGLLSGLLLQVPALQDSAGPWPSGPSRQSAGDGHRAGTDPGGARGLPEGSVPGWSQEGSRDAQGDVSRQDAESRRGWAGLLEQGSLWPSALSAPPARVVSGMSRGVRASCPPPESLRLESLSGMATASPGSGRWPGVRRVLKGQMKRVTRLFDAAKLGYTDQQQGGPICGMGGQRGGCYLGPLTSAPGGRPAGVCVHGAFQLGGRDTPSG